LSILFKAIGTIHTPYLPSLPVPHQAIEGAPGEFWITLNPEYLAGLDQLSSFRYLYILYYLDQAGDEFKLRVNPPWAPEVEVGLFAGRAPQRPNPLGLSIVELKGIEGNEILISGIDVYNNTPLLDIKPYFKSFDLKPNANDGWIDDLPDHDHVLAHLFNRDHDHGHNHEHGQEHSHSHSHSHTSGHDHNLTADVHAHNHAHDHNHSHSHIHSYAHNHTHDHTHTHSHEHENHGNHPHPDHLEHDHNDQHHNSQGGLHGHAHHNPHTHIDHDHTHAKRFKGNLKKPR